MNSSIKAKQPTILIFDSGVGGLSVYDKIRQLMPDLHYIYAFDNQGFPYGDKPEEMIIQRVTQMIEKIHAVQSIDLAVIACNTASTICLPMLRNQFIFPIVGVVPAIKPAAKISQNKSIGLLATKATIKRAYTSKLVEEFAQDCHVEMLGLSELAIIAENKLHGQVVNMAQLSALMAPWLNLAKPLDTIVLGCTHYPFIQQELQQLFPDVRFVDSGQAIASRVQSLLSHQMFDGYELATKMQNQVISTQFDENVAELLPTLTCYNLSNYDTITLDVV